MARRVAVSLTIANHKKVSRSLAKTSVRNKASERDAYKEAPSTSEVRKVIRENLPKICKFP